MEWIVGFLVVSVVLMAVGLVKLLDRCEAVERRIAKHVAAYRHEVHFEDFGRSLLIPHRHQKLDVSNGMWDEVWEAINRKMDKPLLRRSTDVNHNRRKGGKK